MLQDAENHMLPSIIEQIALLSQVASEHPYYKFNHMWTHRMQDAVCVVLIQLPKL